MAKMRSFYIFIYFLLFSVTSAFDSFDFVEDALKKYVNHSASPCDDFYRHACPVGLPFNVLYQHAYENLTSHLLSLQNDAFWNDFTFRETNLKKYNDSDVPKKYTDFLKGSILEICIKKRDLLPWFFEIGGLSDISSVSANCVNLMEVLDNDPIFIDAGETSTSFITSYLNLVLYRGIEQLKAINAMLDEDVSEGIQETDVLIDEMVLIAKGWIEKTPWAANNNVTDTILNTASSYVFLKNLAKNFVSVSRNLVKFEKIYKECTEELDDMNHRNLTCHFLASSAFQKEILLPAFTLTFNGFNSNSTLMFSYPIYHYQQHGRELAARLGAAGLIIGHEVAHSLINNNGLTSLKRPFSIKAEKCIKNQFQSTCDEFKEESCQAYDVQLGENGADILGLQLVYEVLQQHYGSTLEDKIDRLGVTNEQLFFYAAAFTHCSGVPQKQYMNSDGEPNPHSPGNIRVNAMAQHPGFKKAFNCCRDSRMMRSATEQCLVYGERAPQTRKTAGNDNF